jgi:hypothetical protein
MSSAVTSTLLSAAERTYAEGFMNLTEKHLDSVFQTMPQRFRALKAADMVVEPSLGSYVFCRAAADLDEIRLSGRAIKLDEDDVYILPYRTIKEQDWLVNDEVDLL